MSDVILKDQSGNDVVYNDVSSVDLLNTSGSTSTFVLPAKVDVNKVDNITTINITTDNETTSVELSDGFTPIKGVDYWTTEDVDSFNTKIASEVSKFTQLKPEFANSVEECTDTSKLYVLPDGYIYAYMTKKTYTEAPELWDKTKATANYRISGSSEVARNGYYLTELIRADTSLSDPLVLRFKNGKLFTGNGDKIGLYREDGTLIKACYIYSTKIGTGGQFVHLAEQDGSDYIIKIGYGYSATTGDEADATTLSKIDVYDEIHWIKINQCLNSSGTSVSKEGLPDCNLTIDAMGGTRVETGWLSTGHAFVPADYEDRIESIEQSVTSLQSGSIDKVVIPSFWEDAVKTCITKIKSLQVGRNCVTFPFFSDNHQRLGYTGNLIAKVMKECNIPYCFYGGDSIDSGYISSENAMIIQDQRFDANMKAIPNGRFCRAVGNHDGFWNVSASTGDEHYYSRDQVYELFLREESLSQTKQFGGDGTYYYVDDVASRVRFIVLNTNGVRDTSGNITGKSIDDNQLDWLTNTALVFDSSDWDVVIISHAPISNHYHANLNNATEVVNLLNTYVSSTNQNKGRVVGWFSGHIHRDRIYKGIATDTTTDAVSAALPFTQVTVTSDNTGIAYDDTTKHPVAEDNLSHAIDFVTINKSTRKVNITRLGIGSDREFTY